MNRGSQEQDVKTDMQGQLTLSVLDRSRGQKNQHGKYLSALLHQRPNNSMNTEDFVDIFQILCMPSFQVHIH